jgi:hypothetical protein
MLCGTEIGRIYRTNSHEEKWLWSIYEWGSELVPTLEEAKEQLKAQWQRRGGINGCR